MPYVICEVSPSINFIRCNGNELGIVPYPLAFDCLIKVDVESTSSTDNIH